jgi:hypothetical protein
MQPNRLVASLALALTIVVGGCDTLAAAELAIPPPPALRDVSVQTGPPNCSRWTDECVSCTRGAKGEPAVCSNIGFACQPKVIRCLGAQ